MSCSKPIKQESTNKPSSIQGELKIKEGLTLKNLEITDQSSNGQEQEIRLNFEAIAQKSLFENIKPGNTLVAYVTCNSDHGRTYVAGQVFEKSTLMPYNFNELPVLFNDTEKRLEFVIPFRNLELPKGSHVLSFKVEFYVADFKIDPKKTNEGYFLSKQNTLFASWHGEKTFTAPDLQQVALKINHISLNTFKKDPKTYDIRFAGPGYPDLYWEVKCAGESIYKSPVDHNSIKIDASYTTPFFYCCPEDEIEIGVYDQDETSKADVVEVIKKKLSIIGGKTKQGNLENIHVEVIKK